ncbi:MAG: GIY-YIG nuclease family protein [Peptoniphilus sp.]|nr:GIY-YIG nuclease family protein [Peptoniphilus sp.]MDY3119180.1 GIY-YIG nuclease family protein [Peptoniphilus sp.]
MEKLTKHYVYILRCADDTLYTGYTTDPVRRLQEHNHGFGAKYTRSRRPVTMVYLEEGSDVSWGLRREAAIKKLSRYQKLQLIEKAGNHRGKTSR